MSGGKRFNEPIRRYKFDRITQKDNDLSAMVSRKSMVDFHCALTGSYQVSKDGQKIIGIRINSDFRWEIVKENMNYGQVLFFPRMQTNVINNCLLYTSPSPRD